MKKKPSVREKYTTLLESIAFAARAHHGQMRKDRQTPYVSHVFRVCTIVRHVFGCDDPRALIAAVLHDVIEDTRTDYDDLGDLLGAEATPIVEWVVALSKETRLPEKDREDRYVATLAAAPWPVKLCKLADVFDNLMDSAHLSAAHRTRTVKRSEHYLSVLDQSGLTGDDKQRYEEIHQRAVGLVRDLLTEQRADLKRRQ